ncbi:MAG: hypothetical protein M3081_01200 [Gemmatimonadota bacterium]|nr:hypothetical protein [Gemmatimonadota bacterium]
MRTLLRVASCLVLLGGCIHNGGPGGQSTSTIITEEEIDAAQAPTAYDVVQKLRPSFMTARGKSSIYLNAPIQPNVILDAMAYGPLSSLRGIPASSVHEIRYLNSSDAVIKYGSENGRGVIEVWTRRQ